ncbi:MAG: glycosyltransferase [Planctomycetes bacterium]|nr:glycosyltransferase [Planctomycetota bacterium]
MRPLRSISVLMPTWQGIEFLDRVLAALATQRTALPWDFRAIDSGSTDGTFELLSSWAQRFPVPFALERIDQVEFDHGDTRNLLAARSSGDLLVYLTQDAIPTSPEWLARLAANFADARVGAAYCRNVPRPDARLLTKIFSANDPGYQAGRREVRLPDAATYARMSAHERRVLYNFNDVASALRRELWERHPFPRTWFGEDVLLARAVLEAGFTVVYDDEATVEHSHDYGPEETHERAKIDGRFNAEWLDRVCVASKDDARILEKRVLEDDAAALLAEGLDDARLGAALVEAARLRTAAFEGLYEGGRSLTRRPGTRLLPAAGLKVLYVVHGFPPETWAGTEVYTLNLARAIAARGHQVVVLARSPGTQDGPPDFSVTEEPFEGLRVLRLVNRLAHRRLSDSYRDERAEVAFRDVLRAERPDVVHFQHLIHLSAGLVHVAREEGLPALLTLHDYWALCARVQLIRPDGVRCEENQGAGCFLCVKEKHLDRIGVARFAGAVLGPVGELAASLAGRADYRDMTERHDYVTRAYAAADLRVSPSRFLRRKFVETASFDPHTLVFSANGMRTDHVRALEKRPDPQGRVRFGFVGSLVWYKGGRVLIEALKRLEGRPCVLNVFGGFEPERDPHHAELARLAGPNVVFRGRFDNARLAEVYAEIDVLVVPSIWFENAPITIHEAHLCATPVVASGIGGMAEFVRDGIDGLHFAPGDAEDLARKLARFLDEPGLAAALSRAFPSVKTIEEDAAATEFRYRQLACVALARRGSGTAVLLDVAGADAARREGAVERQGADMLLLRAGSGAAVEFDLAGAGGGPRRIEIVQLALGAEPGLELGLAVLVDGLRVGQVGPRSSGGADLELCDALEVELPPQARTLRLETLRVDRRETEARLRRVRVLRAAPPNEASAT